MARPLKCRHIASQPGVTYFKPRGIPLSELEEVVLALDETEALRLADLEGLYHDAAAARMKVSRQTFGNIVHAAHRKVAEAIVQGKALKIEGGAYHMEEHRKFVCNGCGHPWELPYGTGRPSACPQCKGTDVQRSAEQRGRGRCGGGRGSGRGRRQGGGRCMGRRG